MEIRFVRRGAVKAGVSTCLAFFWLFAMGGAGMGMAADAGDNASSALMGGPASGGDVPGDLLGTWNEDEVCGEPDDMEGPSGLSEGASGNEGEVCAGGRDRGDVGR